MMPSRQSSFFCSIDDSSGKIFCTPSIFQAWDLTEQVFLDMTGKKYVLFVKDYYILHDIDSPEKYRLLNTTWSAFMAKPNLLPEFFTKYFSASK